MVGGFARALIRLSTQTQWASLLLCKEEREQFLASPDCIAGYAEWQFQAQASRDTNLLLAIPCPPSKWIRFLKCVEIFSILRMGVGIGCMWKGICRGHRIEPFWRGIPTPVIYLKNHTRAVIARHFFPAWALEPRGLLWRSTIYFRCGQFPLGSKILGWKAQGNREIPA